MIELCGISYQLPKPTAAYEKSFVIEDRNTDTHCFALVNKNTMTLVFRGTNSIKGLVNDIKFFKKSVPYDNASPKIKVHTGFINAYKSEKIRGNILGLMNDEIDSVRVTGHSLGGALAILCAIDLQYNFPDRDYEVIVFGSPRVGNKAFKKSYDKRIFKTVRVKNKGDIISALPFSFMGYRHVGAEIVLPARFALPIASLQEHDALRYYSNLITFE